MRILEGCYYGERKVIYVQMSHPDHKNGQKLVSVYGHTLQEVISAVDRGLTSAFGKVGASRPAGRPKKKGAGRSFVRKLHAGRRDR